jgi:hypothetical protein
MIAPPFPIHGLSETCSKSGRAMNGEVVPVSSRPA